MSDRSSYVLFFLSYVVLCLGLFFRAINNNWGYDEFAVISLINEINNPEISNFYKSLFVTLGLSGEMADFVVSELLASVITPIRWTYALGLSPIYQFLFLDGATIVQQRVIHLTPHIALFLLGIFIAFNALERIGVSSLRRFLVLIAIFSCEPLLYWGVSLSPYSFHTLCFGLLLWVCNEKRIRFKTLLLSTVCILNYQYFPVVSFIILRDISIALRSKDGAAIWRVFLGALPPVLLMALSTAWTVIRSQFFGVHSKPTNSNLTESELFSIFNLEDLPSIPYRVLNIFEYFLSTDPQFFTKLNFTPQVSDLSFLISLLSLSILAGYGVLRRRVTDDLTEVLILCETVLAFQILLWLLGMMPFMGTRHNLIVMLPLAVVVSIVTPSIFLRKWAVMLGLISMATVSSARVSLEYPRDMFLYGEPTLADHTADKILTSRQTIFVLEPCFLELLSNRNVAEADNIFYRCGSRTNSKIDVVAGARVIYVASSMRGLDAAQNEIIRYFGQVDVKLRPISEGKCVELVSGDKQNFCDYWVKEFIF